MLTPLADTLFRSTGKRGVHSEHMGYVLAEMQHLHRSQPAVSLQLKSLAASTGLLLFTRTPQGLALTRDGAALLR